MSASDRMHRPRRPSRRPWYRRLQRRAACQRGLTLVEVMIIMAVIATLATIATLYYLDVTEQAKVAKAIADIAIVSGDIDTFELLNDRLPNDLAEIGRGTLRDPWGNPYVYLNFGTVPQGLWRKDQNLVPINSTFDLYSSGKDGASQPALTSAQSRDDIVRANDGNYIGLASRY